jgi:uncharacterized membrane protein YgcG
MFATLSTWIVIVAMLLGGTGATALAAQESLPTDFLYPVKTMGEEMHLAFSPGPQARVELLSRYSERRMDEVLKILTKGRPLADEWATRWQEQFNLRLQAAAQLDEPAMIRALEQIRLHLRLQEGRLQAIQANQQDDRGGTLEHVRARLRMQQKLVDGALDDPVAFQLRWRSRQQNADQAPEGPVETMPPNGQVGAGPGPGPQGEPACDGCTPVLDGTGPGPGPNGEPACDTCTPALDGTGPGPGPQGEPACDTCTPALDGTGPGPGPQGEPACDTCTPALDGTGPGPGPQNQGGDDQPDHPSEGGGHPGGSGDGGSQQGPSGSGGSGGGNENGGTGGGGCNSCGGGGGGGSHRP